eukprot:COSAG01_NODE_10790_length_2079_cov_97.672222_3_plen_75_part_00
MCGPRQVLRTVMASKLVHLMVCLYAALVVVALTGSLMFSLEAGNDGQIKTLWEAMCHLRVTILTTLTIRTTWIG